jgi:hypothetical protein
MAAVSKKKERQERREREIAEKVLFLRGRIKGWNK